MKEAVLNFIQQKGLKIPRIHTEYEGGVICYIHFSIPQWDFFIYEIDETGDFANAIVHSPFTHDTPDHGLIPLKNFAEKYTEAFSNEFDFYAAKIDETFTPIPLVEAMKSRGNG
ncbi:hypothetical protein [Haemophilus haemolyticus]|uniref:hypothetical protein n=1 Tax=Haemophilus haemolyticus TaxID=726 RepID=UPI000803192C|nr:hypothetical protein [Haemophilus haemolyticus]OBX86492.1 hypothetical protein A9499_08045 [Haemophilus haemolyticus]